MQVSNFQNIQFPIGVMIVCVHFKKRISNNFINFLFKPVLVQIFGSANVVN